MLSMYSDRVHDILKEGEGMKVAVVGSRNLCVDISGYMPENTTEIVSGGAGYKIHHRLCQATRQAG